ncbi:SRPBCC family protein [Streptomyces sp. NPDC056534]|uniref:SRPBCC family protein n=1 Tax=Streptomyces sp. NPDC056534 TaxID=3345857 RepID=UPI0036BCEB45
MTNRISRREWSLAESVLVSASRRALFDAATDLHRMSRWSPECVAIWARRRPLRKGARFVGFNKTGAYVWFTSCRVTQYDRGHHFAFDVRTFGLPVARWGYCFVSEGDATRVTEYWQDLRTGRGARLTEFLGKVCTGTSAPQRAHVNRESIRRTLHRMKQDMEVSRS